MSLSVQCSVAEGDTDLPKEDMVLLKEPGLYCFLLRYEKPNHSWGGL